MGVGCGQNLFKQHRCSRRECVSAALHPVVGNQMRHEWEIFVEGGSGRRKHGCGHASESLKSFQQSFAKFCSHCHGVTPETDSQTHPNHLHVAMTFSVTDLSFSE